MLSPRLVIGLLGSLAFLNCPLTSWAQTTAAATTNSAAAEISYTTIKDVAYYSDEVLASAEPYQRTQCRMDLYLPTNKKGFATVLWFHGGGLTGGSRHIPAQLQNSGFAVVGVGYRLSPQGKLPCFLEDAAAATAWVMRNIEKHGGDPKKVFVSGHSAGGYLAMMIGLDPHWMAAQKASAKDLAGIISVSGQMTTHFHVRKLRGDDSPSLRPVLDEYAPLHFASAALPPICLVVGDPAIEFLSRVEENALMAVTLRNLGHKQVVYHSMGGLDHGSVGEGGLIIVRDFVTKVAAGKAVGAAAK